MWWNIMTCDWTKWINEMISEIIMKWNDMLWNVKWIDEMLNGIVKW